MVKVALSAALGSQRKHSFDCASSLLRASGGQAHECCEIELPVMALDPF
ncbi:hypothetical protein [Xanthomonas vasicola]|nr:hypothetical protein [Xanthomonas vasicola]MBV6893038.1 hypothetical protein [Xanthomonas vasicola pv. vasculorum]MDO6934847.1 hypothetical protein [Xanthomonas vasicola]MDO6948759.1 hypothetical protein [Xanthomonas vasicola]